MTESLLDRLRRMLGRWRADRRQVGVYVFVSPLDLPGVLLGASHAVMRRMGGQALGPGGDDLKSERWRVRGAVVLVSVEPGFEDETRLTLHGRMTVIEAIARALRRELRMDAPA